MSEAFNDAVRKVLSAAGWYPGRREPALLKQWQRELVGEGGFTIFPAAERALLEFGGLRIDERGPGIDRAREPFVLDPSLAVGAESVFLDYAGLLQKRLFPLGEAGGQAFIAIAESGEVFLIFEGILLIAATIEDALANLIEGRRMPGAEWLYE